MIRHLYLFGIMCGVCLACLYIKVERAENIDGTLCANELFAETIGLLDCAVKCWGTSDCGRIYFTSENNHCTGCLSKDIQTQADATDLIGYSMGVPTITYLGCFQDYHPARSLNGISMWISYSMTNELCLSYCSDRGFLYSGTQYYKQCYCGNTINMTDIRPESQCSTSCKGNAAQKCGGGMRLSISTCA